MRILEAGNAARLGIEASAVRGEEHIVHADQQRQSSEQPQHSLFRPITGRTSVAEEISLTSSGVSLQALLSLTRCDPSNPEPQAAAAGAPEYALAASMTLVE